MIQVEPISPVRAIRRVGRVHTDSAFMVSDEVAPSPTGLSSTAELDATSLVSLQEAVAPATTRQRDRAARARCDGLLAALGRMQRSWLGGTELAGALDSLRRLAAEPPDAADPALLAVVAGAVTRARVEIARHNGC